MTRRQFDTIMQAVTPEPARAWQPSVRPAAHRAHDGPLSQLTQAASGRGDPRVQANALRQASGARFSRAGAALLQMQRDHGNRYVQQVVDHARVEAASLSGPAGGQGQASLRQDVSAARQGGRPLEGNVGAQLGQALGSDFGDVMVHTDARADALTRSLRASAFTVGRDIFFSRGAYAPATRTGRELLAHELTHVVQQAAAPPAGASSSMTVGPAHDHYEREADRQATEITSGGRARPSGSAGVRPAGAGQSRIGSTAGVTLQRKYLDQQPGMGFAAWVDDTTIKKGLVTASRTKIAQVDKMLKQILTAKGSPDWKQVGKPWLHELDAELSKTKYGQTPSNKTSKAFVKRQRAVKLLHDEIQHALSTMKLLELFAATNAAPATTGQQVANAQPVAHAQPVANVQQVANANVQQVANANVQQVANANVQQVANANVQQVANANVQQVANANVQQVANANVQQVANANVQQVANANANVQQPQTGRPDQAGMVAELKKVGFVDDYLDSLAPSGELDLLYDAHMALGAGHLLQAQQLLDLLNPLTAATGASALPHGWAQEAYEKHPFIYDFARNPGDFMAAQRQLLVYHAATIGGDYAKLMSYKPYKANALTPAEEAASQRYFKPSELREWHKVAAVKDDATDRARDIVRAAQDASDKSGKTGKPRKQDLTEEEVTAIGIYTADVYKEINSVFRDFRIDAPTANWEKYSAIAKLAISGLGKLPKARNAISYRGDNDIKFAGHMGVLKYGATFRLPNFYSTTVNVAKAFDGDLAYIFHNKRAGRLIQELSMYHDEAEILIPPGAPFRVTGEYHLQAGTWVSHDGKPLDAAPQSAGDLTVRAFLDGNGKPRTTVLEFTEIT